jgi:ribonuclease P protein component
MLPKSIRFTSLLFDRVFRKAKRVSFGSYLFLVSDSRLPHFSVVVGKKISKKAVVRNRLRRQLYEIIRQEISFSLTNKNIILLYNGGEILDNPTEFRHVCQRLQRKIQS